MNTADTIAAIATPPGRGGIGIVRISGSDTAAIASAVLGAIPPARQACLARFRDSRGETIDRGIALYFPAPASYTGEDVLELQGHGGPVVLDLVLAAVVQAGARLARAGEFSERAFLNAKLDLAQAEAVADLIASGSEAAARSALRSLEGAFSQQVQGLLDALVELRAFIEAAIDFPEEEIDFLRGSDIDGRLARLDGQIATLLASSRQGRLLHDGMQLVLAGAPNAGKSSLLNALSNAETAIVSPVAGTTRDIVREQIHIDGMPIHVFDTAGLRDGGDTIEVEGMRRAQLAMQRADRVLLVVDDTIAEDAEIDDLRRHLPQDLPFTVVLNKIDLSGRRPGPVPGRESVAVSAITGAGIDELRRHLKQCMGFEGSAGVFMARRRHVRAIERARDHLRLGLERWRERAASELLAEELRLAQHALGEVTGEFSSEDLLGEIFSGFCIGK